MLTVHDKSIHFRLMNGCPCETVEDRDRNCLELMGIRTPTFKFMPNALTTWVIRARHLLYHVFKYCIWRYKYFSCDQAALWMGQSVCLSVCPSVTPFWLYSHHRIITKFSGVITNDKSDVHAKSQGQRSKVKGTEIKKIVEFDPDWVFPDSNSSMTSPMATKWRTKLEVAY